ncbi:MAG: DUF1214 domain-containing protein [Candidatus Acidiferrales bacterium]
MTTTAQNGKPVLVTADTFTRAETDKTFDGIVKLSGLGKFAHNRGLAPLDNQVVQRGNRDTLYSLAVFDLDAGPVMITLPDAGTRFKTLVTAPDGSLTMYVQSSPPEGDKLANWLPAPKENFVLYIRAYWPEESALNGTWTPPIVIKVK